MWDSVYTWSFKKCSILANFEKKWFDMPCILPKCVQKCLPGQRA